MNLGPVEALPHRTVVSLSGRLDTLGVESIETSFNAAVVARRVDAIVDLSGVEFLSSMGVRMLLTAAKALQRAGARLVLAAPGPLVDGALRHSSLAQVIRVSPDRDAAAAWLDGKLS
jgi:anti-sigma B factor antagonist